MHFIKIPLAQQQNIPSAGGTLSYDLKKVVPRIGRAHLHIAWIEIDLFLKITSAAAASAIAVRDFPAFISAFNLRRSPTKTVFAGLSGWSMYAYQVATALGKRRGKYPATIALNANAATTRAFRFVIPFDRPFAGHDRWDHLWPLGAFQREGSLDLTIGPPSGNTGITFTDGNGTCDVNLYCLPQDSVFIPPDLRYEQKQGTTGATQVGMLFPGNRWIRDLIYAPYKLGGETLTNIQIDGTPYVLANQFKKQNALGSGTVAGSSYQDNYLATNVLDTDDTTNEIVNGYVVPLWAPGAFSEATKAAFFSRVDWNLDINNSGAALTNVHNFVLGSVFSPDEAEIASICEVHGVKAPGSGQVLKAVPDPTSGRPISGMRAHLIPRRVGL